MPLKLTERSGVNYAESYLTNYGALADSNLAKYGEFRDLARLLDIPIFVDTGISNQVEIRDPERISFASKDFYYSGCNREPNLPTAIQVMHSKEKGIVGYFLIWKSNPKEFREKMVPLSIEWQSKLRGWVVSATLGLIQANRAYLDLELQRERFRYANRDSKGNLPRKTPFDADLAQAEFASEKAKKVRGSDFPLSLQETLSVYSQIDPSIWSGVQGGYYDAIGAETQNLCLPVDSLTNWYCGGKDSRSTVWRSDYTTRKVKIIDGNLVVTDEI
jgi:hypothetical protein